MLMDQTVKAVRLHENVIKKKNFKKNKIKLHHLLCANNFFAKIGKGAEKTQRLKMTA